MGGSFAQDKAVRAQAEACSGVDDIRSEGQRRPLGTADRGVKGILRPEDRLQMELRASSRHHSYGQMGGGWEPLRLSFTPRVPSAGGNPLSSGPYCWRRRPERGLLVGIESLRNPLQFQRPRSAVEVALSRCSVCGGSDPTRTATVLSAWCWHQ